MINNDDSKMGNESISWQIYNKIVLFLSETRN